MAGNGIQLHYTVYDFAKKVAKNVAKSSLNLTFSTIPTCRALIVDPKPTVQK